MEPTKEWLEAIGAAKPVDKIKVSANTKRMKLFFMKLLIKICAGNIRTYFIKNRNGYLLTSTEFSYTQPIFAMFFLDY